MSAECYLSNAMKNLEAQLAENGMQFKGTVKSITTPLTTGYQPELDASQECTKEEVTMFQNLIGILSWEVEHGRINVHLEVSLLSCYLVSPHKGHLDETIHIF